MLNLGFMLHLTYIPKTLAIVYALFATFCGGKKLNERTHITQYSYLCLYKQIK